MNFYSKTFLIGIFFSLVSVAVYLNAEEEVLANTKAVYDRLCEKYKNSKRSSCSPYSAVMVFATYVKGIVSCDEMRDAVDEGVFDKCGYIKRVSKSQTYFLTIDGVKAYLETLRVAENHIYEIMKKDAFMVYPCVKKLDPLQLSVPVSELIRILDANWICSVTDEILLINPGSSCDDQSFCEEYKQALEEAALAFQIKIMDFENYYYVACCLKAGVCSSYYSPCRS